MVKFVGFDKNGKVILVSCKFFNYSDLPKKGLGKSMEEVNLYEPLIIHKSSIDDNITWGYTACEIESRAYELNSEIAFMEIPPDSKTGEKKYQIWFH